MEWMTIAARSTSVSAVVDPDTLWGAEADRRAMMRIYERLARIGRSLESLVSSDGGFDSGGMQASDLELLQKQFGQIQPFCHRKVFKPSMRCSPEEQDSTNGLGSRSH